MPLCLIYPDWSNASLIGAPQWPLSFISYIYVWQNMTAFNLSGPVLEVSLLCIVCMRLYCAKLAGCEDRHGSGTVVRRAMPCQDCRLQELFVLACR